MDATFEPTGEIMAERRTVVLQAAEERGLLGAKDRTVGGRLPDALVEQAKRVHGTQRAKRIRVWLSASEGRTRRVSS